VEVFTKELGNVGILICADNSFPELPRVITLDGAEIICVCFCRPKGLTGDLEAYHRFVSCGSFEDNNFLAACSKVGREGGLFSEGRSYLVEIVPESHEPSTL
jgi:predicted amidohydrolase